MSLPLVAIVGRPNVGKSTLLNRLAGERRAIVEDVPGTTRDRIYADVTYDDREFTVVDTGGLEVSPGTSLARQVKAQVEMAIAEADAIVFMVDVREGLTAGDEEVAALLRRSGKPLLLAANKAETRRRAEDAVEFYRLGMGEPATLSAYHGRGVGDLLDRLMALLPQPFLQEGPEAAESPMMGVAIVGRPNVGKSMLLNTIVGQERALVTEMPGTTRDALDTPCLFQEQPVLLIDTAGLRRRGHITPGVERYSVLRAMRAIGRADVAVLVTEAPAGLTAQDLHIAGFVHEAYKGIVVAVNKWDLVEEKDTATYTAYIRGKLKFMPYAPVVFTSALHGSGVEEVLEAAHTVYQERLKQPPSDHLQKVVEEAFTSHRPPTHRGRSLRVFSTAQVRVNPPTFMFRVNDPRLLHFSYERYLENRLRQAFGFRGTPLRLLFRSRGRK
ncbi:MAG: ribosome biogenesis GTPase Der [Dehalococcoidia bacterium]